MRYHEDTLEKMLEQLYDTARHYRRQFDDSGNMSCIEDMAEITLQYLRTGIEPDEWFWETLEE